MGASSGLFLATVYNQSQLAEGKHVARYWSISTAATADPLSAHPSPIEVAATKLAAAILGGGGVVRRKCAPVGIPLYTFTSSTVFKSAG